MSFVIIKMEQMRAFYVTLPSNSSMNIFPSNTLTNYVTQLPNSIYLDGEWEVGLAEIQYPYTWNNIREGYNKIYIKTWNEHDYTPVVIPSGYYKDINNLIYNIRQLIGATGKFRDNDVDLRYVPTDKRTSVYVKSGCHVKLDGDIATVLGFETGTVVNNTLLTSPFLSLVTGNVSSLFIYSDIIQSQYVGDVKVPLLRAVGVEGKHGDFITKSFDRPQYLPVCRQTLDTVEIDIKGDTAEKISFQHGKVIVKLHFRKQRPVYFS